MTRRSHLLAASFIVAALSSDTTRAAAQISGTGDTSPVAVRFYGFSGNDRSPVLVDANRVVLLRRRISLGFEGITLDQALREISATGAIRFAYSGADVPLSNRVSLHAEDMTLAAVLTEVLIDAGVDVVLTAPDQVTLVRQRRIRSMEVAAVSASIVGSVTDSSSLMPIEAADVSVDSLRIRVSTNLLGRYRLQVPPGRHTVTVRRIGYKAASLGVEVADSSVAELDIALVPVPTRLKEIIATATGPQRRYELGNAIATINADSIVATQPVRSLTDLLETRVPGLTATHTSGAPGDPTRLRLRGLNSVTRSNDPIVIVDGVRIYSDQSDVLRGGNLAVVNGYDGKPITGRPNAGENVIDKVAVRSPLDQIDPHSVERIEVFKGPSAATLYGADAANGVIVITTKQGREGPARWSIGTDYATTYQPGRYPNSYFRWGHDIATGQVSRCPLVAYNCVIDSLVQYQVLNDPRLTVFGRGNRKALNVGVTGGNARLTYALNGSFSDEVGLLKMPDFEVSRYATLTGEKMPGWMKRPHNLTDWSGTGHLTVAINPSMDIAFTSTVNRSTQQRSTLEDQIGTLAAMYADTILLRFYPGQAVNTGTPQTPGGALQANGTLVSGFRIKTTSQATSFTEAANLNWRPLSWLSTTASLGLNIVDRQDESTQPLTLGDDPYTDWFSFENRNGFFNLGTGNSAVTTANLGAVAMAPLSSGLRLRTAFGGNYTATRTNDLIAAGTDLIPGATGLEGARTIVTTPQRSEVTTFGWYIEPTLEHKRFFLSTGLRLDGGDTYGSQQSLAGFPKVSLSYLLSDEPFFPFKNSFSTLRVRAAYGQAGVQPGPADRLRLYQTRPGWYEFPTDQTELTSVGNVNLKPERSEEFEGGIDADLFGDKITLELTAYSKTRKDALVPVTLPPSVNGGGTTLVNIGRVRNRGFEIAIGTNLIRKSVFSLNTQFHISRNRNKVLSTGSAGTIVGSGGSRVVAGYPLFGLWAKPIVSYADVNQDGIINRSEVQLGDKEVFLGAVEPEYEAALYTNMSFLRGIVTLTTGFSYTRGQLQINQAAVNNAYTVRALNDPTAPLSEQAAAVVREETSYGLAQVLSTFRFNSLALSFNAPEGIARMFRARTASFTVQGTNLGLKTNYRGKDPGVNAYATGNTIADTGELPLPRTWSFGLRFGL